MTLSTSDFSSLPRKSYRVMQSPVSLSDLAKQPAYALEIGKAGEHLVCFDLISQGYRCYLTDQGLPYDLIADLDGRLIRIQVKTACFPKNVNSQGKNPRIAYSFAVRKRGKLGASRLSDDMCDIVALVAMNIKTVAYLPVSAVAQTVYLSAPLHQDRIRHQARGGLTRNIDELPIFEAATNIGRDYEQFRRTQTHCKLGHPFSVENTSTGSHGERRCVICRRAYGRMAAQRRRLKNEEVCS